MINECIKQYQDEKSSNIDSESKEDDVLSNSQSKKRRTISSVSKNFTCPFKGCDKQYLTSTSLKLHCKRVHCDDEPLKQDYSMKSPIKKHKRGVDLTKVFKPEDLKRLQYNADEDIVGTLFDGLATNTYFGSINPGPTKKLKIERAKSMYHEGYDLSKKVTLNLKKPISFENSLESQMSDEISDSQDIQKKDPNFYQYNDERPTIKEESYTKDYKHIETGKTSCNSNTDIEQIKIHYDLFDATEKIDNLNDNCFAKKDLLSFDLFGDEDYHKFCGSDNDQIFDIKFDDEYPDTKYMFPSYCDDMFYELDELSKMEPSKITDQTAQAFCLI